MNNYESTKFRRVKASSPHSWILEISMVFLSVAALLAVSILLPLYHDKPLSSWTFFLSFNTIISILGAISRSSLAFAIGSCISQEKWNWFRQKVDYVVAFDRFDEASRGPWGSIRLLYWIRFRHWVAIGAACTVVLLGFEPLLQAGITFYGKEVTSVGSDATARIGRAQRLDVGRLVLERSPATIHIPQGEIHLKAVRVEPDFQPLAALWTGFSNLSSTEDRKPSFTCSTGNCTWAPYASLAVCSACADISDKMDKLTGRARASDDGDTEITMPYKFIGIGTDNTSYAFTKYEIKELGMNLSNFDNGQGMPIHSRMGQLNATLTAKASISPGDTISFKGLKTLIGSFGIMQASQDFKEGRTSWEKSKVVATECALYFCTNVYKSMVVQGVLEDTVQESYAMRNPDSFLPFEEKDAELFKAYDEALNYSIHVGGADVLRSDLQLIIPSNAELSKTTKEEGDLRFNISQNAVATITSLFSQKFALQPLPFWDKQLIYPDPESVRSTQPAVILSLGTSSDIARTFENAAGVMSKWIRESASPSETAKGTATLWVTHIRVQWDLISLPVATLLTGCIFCLLSMWETRRLKLQPWKGSSLATLAVGLDAESQKRLKAADTLSLMNEYVRDTKVKLVDSKLGSELATVDARA
ncbi:hypothetical protein HJFPF1_02087 [Paramyrothecium foliicola]|nr:hypothetical protein HJFPF1_02087 [Paramyrothecium foliicola]